MAVSTLLEILEVSENQAAKATAANTAIQQLEKALAETLNVATAAATTPGDDITLPYSAVNDLSNRDALRCVFISLTAGATAVFNVLHPAKKHLFVLRNNTSHDATIKCAGQTGVVVGSGDTSLLYCNGTDVIGLDLVASGGGSPISHPKEISVAYYGTPTSSEIIGKMIVANNLEFLANFSGSVGAVEVNPTATFAIDVQDDGVSIGTVSISTGGVFTFTTAGGTAQTVNAGSIIEFIAPASVDATISDIFIALSGSV